MKLFKIFAASLVVFSYAYAQSVSEAVFDPKKGDESQVTIEYRPNPNFRPCSCDT